MAADEERDEHELTPRETLSAESLVAYITAEPAFLGSERLLILGRSVLTDIGDIVNVLAVDDSGVVHVLFLSHGEADEDTLAQLIPQGAWVDGLGLPALKSIFAGSCDYFTLEEAFEHLFARELPTTINERQILPVVASSIDDDVFEALEDLADRSDGLVRAVSFREFEHGEDVLVQTKRLV